MNLDKIAAKMAGSIRTAGKIEFIRDQGPLRRDIRVQGFEWRPDVLRSLAKILWAAERSHSYGMATLRLFSKMSSSEFSPDGLLGGRGYIQHIKDMRSALGQAVEVLSAFTDTVHDEINAPHWASLKDESTNEIVEGAQNVKDNPEEFVEKQFHDTAPKGGDAVFNPPVADLNPNADDFNPFLQEEEEEEDEEEANILRESSESVRRILEILESSKVRNAASRIADSSVPPETLPGPRVMHVGPGESPEEFGYFTDDDERPSDDPLGEGFRSLEPILENTDNDGVTGYSNPTDGDLSVFKTSAERISNSHCAYSWLPGSRNEKLMNYYALGITDEDVDWMRKNDEPDPPPGSTMKPPKPSRDPLWDR